MIVLDLANTDKQGLVKVSVRRLPGVLIGGTIRIRGLGYGDIIFQAVLVKVVDNFAHLKVWTDSGPM